MSINKRQADVYVVLTDIIQKFILTIVFTICFVIVLYYLITSDPEWAKTAPLAAIELALTGTVYKMATHFFPEKK